MGRRLTARARMLSKDPRGLGATFRANGFFVTDTTAEEFKVLGHSLGVPVRTRPGGALTERLRPTSVGDAPSRSLSRLHGLGVFPFHTDAAHHRLSPRYVLMRLADGSRSNTPTLLVDADPRSLSPSDTTSLARETWLIHGGFGRTFYSSILDSSRRIAFPRR
jgi:hypothetical protein